MELKEGISDVWVIFDLILYIFNYIYIYIDVY